MIYLVIFFLKLLENALGTVRMIVCTNGKKILGAVLQFLIGLVWIISASLAIAGSMHDPFKIFIFAIGSAVGSYVGCFVEEKLALGNVLLIVITHQKKVLEKLQQEQFTFTVFVGNGTQQENFIIMIAIPRKRKKEVTLLLTNQDSNIMIISEFADVMGGNLNGFSETVDSQ